MLQYVEKAISWSSDVIETRSQKVTSRLDKALTDSGRKPFRLVSWLAVAWVLNTVVFSTFADKMAPTNAALLLNSRKDCTPQGRTHPQWTRCAQGAMKDYPKFYPPLYALDVLVPIMDLQQSRLWQPISRDGWPGFFTFLYRCFAGAFGWLLGVALVSLATRFVGSPDKWRVTWGLASSDQVAVQQSSARNQSPLP